MGPENRIGHTERERAAEDLARHYEAGRLDHDEYSERLDAVWSARTLPDLAILFTDLPRLPAPVPARPRPPALTDRVTTLLAQPWVWGVVAALIVLWWIFD